MTRSFDPDFDQRIADWLEVDPVHAPREVLTTILAAHPSIPQRRATRVPWRFPSMRNNRLGLAAAIAVVLVVGVFGYSRLTTSIGLGGPSPSATQAASPASAPTSVPTPAGTPAATSTPLPSFTIHAGVADFTQVHVSDVYRYGMRFPSQWTLDPGKHQNTPDSIPEIGLGYNDFYGDGKNSGVYVTAGALSGLNTNLTTFSGFIYATLPHAYTMYSGPGCRESTRSLQLDGEPANEHDFYCPGGTALWVTAVHGGLAYQVAWLDDGGFTQAQLRPKLDQFLQTFTFAP
ncbi:MAG TPA: hypothetical protein VF484_06625 [Candidatus Limnocylindrales bacterium]